MLSTKLDRDPETGRFDAAQARRSLEESLAALGVERVDILHLHDPEHAAEPGRGRRQGGALAELFRMREEGLARAVGLAAGRIDVMMPLLRDWDFDVADHPQPPHAGEPQRRADARRWREERGIAVLNAAPYAGGALAKGASYGRYVYQEASEGMLEPVRRVEEICARHGVPPGAAALQFSHARSADHRDDLRGDPARAGAGDARLGGLADRRGGLGGAPGAALRHRRPGGDAGLQAGVAAGSAQRVELAAEVVGGDADVAAGFRVVEEVAVALAGLVAGVGGVDGVADAGEGRGDRIERESAVSREAVTAVRSVMMGSAGSGSS